MPKSNAVHSETVWVTQVRQGPEHPWQDNGSYTADKGAVLRIYNFCTEKPSDEFPETRIVRAEVSRFIQDPESLRKILEEETARGRSSDVQSV